MEIEYVVYYGAGGGFLTSSGNYSSELKDAQKYEHGDALEVCRARYVKNIGEFPIVPVAYNDLRYIKK